MNPITAFSVTALAAVLLALGAAGIAHWCGRQRRRAHPLPHFAYVPLRVKAFIVSVQIPGNAPPEALEQLNAYARKFQGWADLTESSWIVLSNGSAHDIRDAFRRLAPLGSRIFVLRSGREAAWTNIKANDAWLHRWL